VAVIDVAKREVVKTIAFAIQGVHEDRVQPVGITLTADGKYAFVALGPANHIAVVDQKTYVPVSYVLVGRRVWHLALTPDEKLLFTTNGISNDVSVIEVPTLKAVKSIKVGRYPWGVAIKP
jgi:YVTN family beta-propeller protein